jgi:hypothetical protein
LSLPVVRRLIAKEQHQGRGFDSFPRYQSLNFARQTTISCDRVRLQLGSCEKDNFGLGLVSIVDQRNAPFDGTGR